MSQVARQKVWRFKEPHRRRSLLCLSDSPLHHFQCTQEELLSEVASQPSKAGSAPTVVERRFASRHKPCGDSAGGSLQSNWSPHQVGVRGALSENEEVDEWPQEHTTSQDKDKDVHRHITAAVERMTPQQRMVAAWHTLEIVPSIEDVLRHKVSALERNITAVLDVVCHNLGTVDGAFPDSECSSFEESISNVNGAVRQLVDNTIRRFEGAIAANDDMVAQMKTLPEAVQCIVAGRIEQAVAESKQQTDHVLNTLRDKAVLDGAALANARLAVTELVEAFQRETVRVSKLNTAVHMENAVALLEPTSSCVPNRVVMDALLRAKACVPCDEARSGAGGQDPDECGRPVLVGDAEKAVSEDDPRDACSGGSPIEQLNPGSIGHPELCGRPCLYFPRGQCSNGIDCLFCHEEHHQRAVHLGRQHRKTLEAASIAECLFIALPIMRQKLSLLAVKNKHVNAENLMDTLAAYVQRHVCSNSNRRKGGCIRARDARTLEKAIRALTFRSLVSTLQKAAGAKDSPEYVLLENLLRHLRDEDFLESDKLEN